MGGVDYRQGNRAVQRTTGEEIPKVSSGQSFYGRDRLTEESSPLQELDVARKEEVMSKSANMKAKRKTSRVQVGELPKQEKELEDREAEQVKGGGGRGGGVIGRQHGEQIPEKSRN